MKRTLMLIAIATLTAFGQKIETQKPDRNKITRLGTTQNHLSVIELGEPVTQVAAGSSSFKIEWRENKVFIQPLEPDATTNLFIWTASGRLSYELVPAGSVEQMHFAIDQDPTTVQAKKDGTGRTCAGRRTTQDTCGHADGESRPSRWLDLQETTRKWRSCCRTFTRRMAASTFGMPSSTEAGRSTLPAAPEVFTLNSPRAPQSLIPLANSQLAGDYQLKWKGEARVPVVHTELQAPVVRPGQTAHGVIAFDLPTASEPGVRTVVKLAFPADAAGKVSAVLVL